MVTGQKEEKKEKEKRRRRRRRKRRKRRFFADKLMGSIRGPCEPKNDSLRPKCIGR